MVFAFMGKPRLRPPLLDDVQRLGKAVFALGIGDAVGLVGTLQPAAPDTEDQPAPAELVDRRGLLGDAQRMAQRQYLHRDADLDALGAGGDRAGDRHRRRQHRARRIDVQLGQPHDVEPIALGGVDLLEGLLEGLALALPGDHRKLVEHAKFHRSPFPDRFTAATHGAGSIYFLMSEYGSITVPVLYSGGSRMTSVLVSLN